MNTHFKHLTLVAGMVATMLLSSISTQAIYLPIPASKGDWYAFGDTVSLAFPRVSDTDIKQQITKDQYDNQSATNTWGVEGIYSKETLNENTYYFYNFTVRDTILLTFTAEADASGNYSVVGHTSAMHGAAADINAIWYIADATPDTSAANPGSNKYWPQSRIRMHVQHLKTGKWIAYSRNAQGDLVLKLVDKESDATPFAYDTREESENYHYGTWRMTHFNPMVVLGANMYYFESEPDQKTSFATGTYKSGNYVKTTRTESYTFRLNNSYTDWMRCFQWSKEHTQHFNIAATPFSTDFSYAADDAAAQAQQMTQSYNISLTDSCNLYCVPARKKGWDIDPIQLEDPKVTNDAKVLEDTFDITAKFYWATWAKDADKYNKQNSVLETKQIDNTMSQSPYNDETSRDMMTMSNARLDNKQWKVTVTPNGGSPFNVIDTTAHYQGSAADYSDLLYCNLFSTNKTDSVLASLGTSFTRRAYHVKTITDSLKVTVSPDVPIVAQAGEDLVLTYNPVITNSTIRYTARGTVDQVISRKDSVITMNDPNITNTGVTLTDVNNKAITGDDAWVKIANRDLVNNKITLHFDANNTVNVRGVNLVVTGKYKGITKTISTYIRQATNDVTGATTFTHQVGGYDELMPANARGIQYQQVHTCEKTVYYTSGEEIELMANEPNMRGYWRWYDYDTDGDPRYHWDGSNWVDAGNNFWKTAPKDIKGNTFTSINAGSAAVAKGYYSVNTSNFPECVDTYSWADNMAPHITGWSDGQERNIALDASAYQDGTFTTAAVTEPTLSYRQIWHLRPAKTIADSLDKCTDIDHPYESHEYIAPIGKTVYLATNLPHYTAQHHQSELCYWFNATISTRINTKVEETKKGQTTTKSDTTVGPTTSTGYKQAGDNSSYSSCVTPQWKVSYNNGASWSTLSNNYATGTDYQQVNSTTAQTVEYVLYIPSTPITASTEDVSTETSGSGRNKTTTTTTTTTTPTCNSDIYLARFKVTYVSSDTYGPSATALRTDAEMAKSYNILEKQDFDFGTTAGSLSSSSMQFYTKPLPPDNSTFGFYYVDANNNHQRERTTQGTATSFPFYGEYCLVNQLKQAGNKNWWIDIAQHGGATSGAGKAADGYMMYVDGKLQPGLAATITSDAVLCSGQQMYCYIWVCNATSSSTNTKPILRFDVQGRQNSNENWTNVASFFMGELEFDTVKNTAWKQVNFPVISAADYAQTRVAIYNFASNNLGNDFLIDDVCLYATKLPLTAYQAYTTCKVKNMEVAVARIDYSNMSSSGTSQELYYAFMHTAKDTMVHAVYHYPNNWTGSTSDKYGLIYVPKKGYDPTKSGDSDYQTNYGIAGVDETHMVYNSASEILDFLEMIYLRDTLADGRPGHDGYSLKGYVLTTEDNTSRYIMYVAHLISDTYMQGGNKYKLNMASSADDLANPKCSNSADLPLANKTDITFGGETTPKLGACANGLYPVTVKVNNSVKINGNSVELSSYAKADWLIGYSFDDVYMYNSITPTDTAKAKADALFKAKYGYERGKVQDALSELRRHTNHSNYTVQNIDEIVLDTVTAGTNDTVHILLKEHYDIIKDLYTRGLLGLYKDSDAFYMRERDTLRFWIYPIQGTAKVNYHDTQNNRDTVITLDNCSNSTFLYASTKESDYLANVSPIKYEDMTDEQKHAVPRVRVAACKANKAFKVPISDITDEVVFGWDSCRVVSSTDPTVQALINKNAGADKFSMRYTQDRLFQTTGTNGYYKAGKDSIELKPIDNAHVTYLQQLNRDQEKPNGDSYNWTTGHPGFQHVNTHTMRAGYEYTMKMTMLTQNLIDATAGCPIGDVYFTVIVVPDTVVWNPTTDYWGDDKNWWGLIDGKEVSMGYVPLAETDVIISTMPTNSERLYPYLCDSMFYPMDAHYVTAKCHKIHFCSNTAMLDQHLLDYDSVYADMSVKNGTWNLVSMPLQGVVSGDFFVPHDGDYTSATNLESGDDFTVSSFQGSRDGQTAGYAAWSRYYNDSVGTVHYDEASKTFAESYEMFKQAADTSNGFFMASSNTLTKPIRPCIGFELGVWGPDNIPADTNITVRLPKPDTEYYWSKDGKQTTLAETVIRENPYKFAFTPDAKGEMKITLRNAVKSRYFLFGNPTMAYIDAESFYYRNSTVIESYYWTLEGDKWVAHSGKLISYEDRFVKPFRAALVYTKGGAELDSLTLTLSTQDLAISYLQGARNNYTNSQHGTPGKVARRRLSSEDGHYLSKGVMHIDAFIRPTGEMTATAVANFDLVATDFANDGYDVSEDVPFFSINIKDNGEAISGASEMNIYSVVETEKVSVDIREQIGVVPLGFVVSNDLRKTDSGKMRLYFTLTDWTDECYLIDSETGTKTRITNGTELYLDIPANNAMRYYIQGSKSESKDDGTTTDGGNTISTEDADGSTISVFSPADGYVNVIASSAIAEVRLYDLVGRLISDYSLTNDTPVLTIPAPAGILLTEVTLRNATRATEKVIVK